MCDLYYSAASAQCRSIQMLAKALGVQLNLKAMNLQNKDHLTPEFLKLNPQHTIPTLVDNGFSIWESRAILIYLAEKYGKNDSFYPKDPKARAVINQRLFFDMGTLYQRMGDYYYPQIMRKELADPEKFKKLEEALMFLDEFLSKTRFAAGEKPTLADFALFATFSTLTVFDVDYSKFNNIARWYEECNKSLPGVEANATGMEAMKEYAIKMKA